MKFVSKGLILKTIFIMFVVGITNCYTNPTACTSSTSFYDIILLQCTTCPSNTNQANDFTYCNCTTSFYDNPAVIGFNNIQSCVNTTVTSS